MSESAFKTRKYYISLTSSGNGGWNYVVYDWRGGEVRDGVLDEDTDIYTAVEAVTDLFPELFGMNPDLTEIDYDRLQEFVS